MVRPVRKGQPEHILFVIDTNMYAGNFERELCAYVTGKVGDCNNGIEQALIAKREIFGVVAKLDEIIEDVSDENGVFRPVSIFPNPKYGNAGGKYVVLSEENKAEFCWPAYFSVAIYFRSVPDSELVEVMKKRAKDFAANENFIVEGFRLLEQRTVYEEKKV